MQSLFVVILIGALLGACSGDPDAERKMGESKAGVGLPGSSSSDSTAPGSDDADPSSSTNYSNTFARLLPTIYADDIRGKMKSNCSGSCHNQASPDALVLLDSYEDVQAEVDRSVAAIENRTMPPAEDSPLSASQEAELALLSQSLRQWSRDKPTFTKSLVELKPSFNQHIRPLALGVCLNCHANTPGSKLIALHSAAAWRQHFEAIQQQLRLRSMPPMIAAQQADRLLLLLGEWRRQGFAE